MTDPETLIELTDVDVDLDLPGRPRTRLLDGISLKVQTDELLAILGPTGSGKSSLVRVAAGLTPPSAGKVEVRGQSLRRASPRLGLVFQSPALFPWLSVQANVELGLERLPVERERKDRMVAWALDRLGLEGFEEAYPRELGQGTKLRVALARALAGQPELLILDDPFAGLDVLTAESLRNELLGLWQNTDVNPKAILLVTHDIQEAVALASRVLVLSGSPAKVALELPISLPYPRDPSSTAFQETVARIHDFLTKQILPDDQAAAGRFSHKLAPLPKAELGQVLGLLEALDDRGGRLDIFDFAAESRREYLGVVMVVNAAEMLGLVATPKDQAEITDLGRQVLRADVNQRKALVNLQLQKIMLFASFIDMIERAPDHAVTKELALEQLAMHFPSEHPVQIFNTLVAWARYAELFGYSARRGLLYLDRTFLIENGELREMKRVKPGMLMLRGVPKPKPESAPLPEAVPEPPAPSEAVLQAAEDESLIHPEAPPPGPERS